MAASKGAPGRKRRKARTARPRTQRPRARDERTKSGFRLEDQHVEKALVTGEYGGMLADYFGESEYEELVQLARGAEARSVRGGPRVLIVPGIMGSKLGRKRALFDDVLWIDPLDIVRGRLSSLKLPDGGQAETLGVILLAYLKLKLYLRLSGFDAEFHPFDWRQDIAAQGKLLAKRVLEEPAQEVHLVAHSMGGLVSRAALGDPRAASKIGKLVMLGTPNFGSFAPVQALRGTYAMVTTLAKVDLSASPLDLAKYVFSTFPGLHQMMPSPRQFSGVDLFTDAAFWRGTGGNMKLLKGVPAFQDGLAAARANSTFLVAGINQETVVGLRWDGDELLYETSRAGDGTVPLSLALLPGATTYYIEEAHGSLPNNGTVEAAVVDLLRDGKTSRLATQWSRGRAPVQSVSEAELRARVAADTRSVREMGSVERRNILASVAAPSASKLVPSTAATDEPSEGVTTGYTHQFRDVVVSRRRQHAIEIELAHGSIAAAKSRALVLGFFQGVDPTGPAAAVDEALGGAILEMVERRMFSADAGQVFVLPAGRSGLYADSVLFAGLGNVEAFKPSVQELVAENVVRTFVRSHVEEFATVILGVSAGMTVEASLLHQLRGYLRGLLEVDGEHRMRRITLCELDTARYIAIKEELHRLTSTRLFEDVRVTLSERRLQESQLSPGTARARVSLAESRIYLITNYEERSAVPVDQATGLPDASKDKNPARVLRSALLTAGGKATVFRDAQRFRQNELDSLLAKVAPSAVSARNVDSVGKEIAKLLLGERIVQGLETAVDDHQLVIVHDAESGRIPWETLQFNGHVPAVVQGLSRRYAADNLSITKWLEERRHRDLLEVLLVVNPTKDLDGANREGQLLERALSGNNGIRLTKLVEGAATREAVLREFASGRYDALHYAGHAFFDATQPSRSGIVCAEGQILSGEHLASLTHVPALVFFNACESGRVRQRDKPERAGERLTNSVGLAEAFLRGGVANYIGTYWPVGDASAELFSGTIYAALLRGQSIGDALLGGRRALKERGFHDWADYIHYGNHDFVLKHAATSAGTITPPARARST